MSSSVVRVTVVNWNQSKNKRTVEQDRQQYWLQQGRCPTCGIHTHEKLPSSDNWWWSSPSKAAWKPLYNEHVLNGRCLACHSMSSSSSSSPSEDDDGEGLGRTKTTTGTSLSDGFMGATGPARGEEFEGAVETVQPMARKWAREASRLEHATSSPEPPPPPSTWQQEKQERERVQLQRAKALIACASVVASLVVATATIVSVFQRSGKMPRTAPRQHLPEPVLPPVPPHRTVPTETFDPVPSPTTIHPTTVLPTSVFPSIHPSVSLPTPEPSVDPIKMARRAHLYALVVSISSEEDLENLESPQRAAFQWLLRDDDYAQGANDGPNPDWVVTQRYVLALFFLATGGSTHWSNSVGMAPNYFLRVEMNECHWHSSIYCEGFRLFPHLLPTQLEVERRVTGFEFDAKYLYNRNGASGITGPLPPEMFAGLPFMQRVIILGERLRGTIPSTMGTLPHLKLLDLSFNPELQGTLPASLFNATSMAHIVVEGCLLEGTIPSTLSPSLESLVVADNSLTGSLPSEFGALPKLLFLHLRRNFFTGKIPTVLGSATQLRVLTLHRNDFQGKVPKSLCRLRKRRHLTKLTVDCGPPSSKARNPGIEAGVDAENRDTGQAEHSDPAVSPTEYAEAQGTAGEYTEEAQNITATLPDNEEGVEPENQSSETESDNAEFPETLPEMDSDLSFGYNFREEIYADFDNETEIAESSVPSLDHQDEDSEEKTKQGKIFPPPPSMGPEHGEPDDGDDGDSERSEHPGGAGSDSDVTFDESLEDIPTESPYVVDEEFPGAKVSCSCCTKCY